MEIALVLEMETVLDSEMQMVQEWETDKAKDSEITITVVSDKVHLMVVSDKEQWMVASEISREQEILIISKDQVTKHDQITTNSLSQDQVITAVSDREASTLAVAAADSDPEVLQAAVEWDQAAEAAVSDPVVDNFQN